MKKSPLPAFLRKAAQILFEPKAIPPSPPTPDQELDAKVAGLADLLKPQGFEPAKSMYAGVAFLDNVARAVGPRGKDIHDAVRLTTDIRKLKTSDTFSMLSVAREARGGYFVVQVDVDAKTFAYKSQGKSVLYGRFMEEAQKPGFDAVSFFDKIPALPRHRQVSVLSKSTPG